MSINTNRICPICCNSARDLTTGDFDGDVIMCATCGTYEISGTVLDRFYEQPRVVRIQALLNAKNYKKKMGAKGRPAINYITKSW